MPLESVNNLLKEKKIFQIVNPKCTTAPADSSIDEVLEVMRSNKSGYCILTRDRKVAGVFTEVDLVRRVLAPKLKHSRPIADVMTSEVRTLTPEDTVMEAIRLMGKYRFYHLPLVNQDQDLVGILSVRTLIRFLAAYYPTEIFNLPPQPDQIMGTQEGG